MDEPDFYLDPQVCHDPYPFYEQIRAECPVHLEPHHGSVLVLGYEELAAVATDTVRYSSCNATVGPFCGFPGAPGVDDASDAIEAHRHNIPLHDYFPYFDPPAHTDHRALLMRLLTPKRLAENEAAMWELADRQLAEFVDDGRCEFIRQFSNPYVNIVICDLLGVPEQDVPKFRAEFDRQTSGSEPVKDSLAWLHGMFTEYVEDRRRQPRSDVLTGLATATFPDGTLPDVIDVVRTAAFLFAAGGETTARLLASALRYIAEDQELQERLRHARDLIPGFVEEVLRLESPIRATSRISRVATAVGGTDISPGTVVTLMYGAANRDPARFEQPAVLDPERPNARQNLAFGRGAHFCPGAPLARAESHIALSRILDRTADIRVSDEHHGPPGDRRFEWTPWYHLRGPAHLHLEFTPITP